MAIGHPPHPTHRSRWFAQSVTIGLIFCSAARRADAAGEVAPPETLQAPATTQVAAQVEGAIRRRAPAQVQAVTGRRAYLNRGAQDGVRLGDLVQLLRAGVPIGQCTVELLSDHFAACAANRAHVGDACALDAPSPVVPSPRSSSTLLMPDREHLQRDAQVIAATPVAKVDYRGPLTTIVGPRTEWSAGYAGWFVVPDSASGYGQERMDASVRGLPLGFLGLHADLAFTAMRLQRTQATARFRPGDSTQFYLWEAEIARRDDATRTVVAAGRIWPWHLPGVPLLDGFQVGRRNQARTQEWGLYAGTLPSPSTLAPTTDRFTFGLYGSLVQPGKRTQWVRFIREEGRLALRNVPGAGVVAEGEVGVQAWLSSFSLGAGGLVRKAESENRPVWERGYLGIALQPHSRVGGSAQIRMTGSRLAEQEDLAGQLPNTQGTWHASADAFWDFLPWLGLRVLGNLHHDAATGFGTHLAAIELRLPRLWPNRGGLGLALEVGQGWVRSRTLSVETTVRFGSLARARAGVSASSYAWSTPATNPDTDELGAHLNFELPLAQSIRLRARSQLRAPIAVAGTFPDHPAVAMVFGLDTAGSF